MGSEGLIEVVFPIKSTDQKTPATARGIKNSGRRLPDTERVDYVDDGFISVVLTKLVALFRADQPLKRVTQYVRRYLMKVKAGDPINNSLPGRQRLFARNRDLRSPLVLVWHQNGIVVARYANCFPELPG